MSWSWETHRWRNSAKIALGLATVWPLIYMGLFFVVIFSVVGLTVLSEQSGTAAKTIDLLQLQTKIRNGEVKELRFTAGEILASDQANHTYRTFVTNESTREEILKEARELDASGRPRVEKIEENRSATPAERFLPLGFVGLFALHMFSILLIIGLMPLYIVLAVKNDHIDQTIKIMWAVLLCTVSMIAMPVYWYLYIWRQQPPKATMPKAPAPNSQSM